MGTNHANRPYFEPSSSMLISQQVGSAILHQELSPGSPYIAGDLRKTVGGGVNGSSSIRATGVERYDGAVAAVGKEKDPTNNIVDAEANALEMTSRLYNCGVDPMVIRDHEGGSKHFGVLLDMQNEDTNMDRQQIMQSHPDSLDTRLSSSMNANSTENTVDIPINVEYDGQFMYEDLFMRNQKIKKAPRRRELYEPYAINSPVRYASHSKDEQIIQNGEKSVRRVAGQRQRIYKRGAKSDASPNIMVSPHITPASSLSSINYSANNDQQMPLLDYGDVARSSPTMSNAGGIYEPSLGTPTRHQGQDMGHIYGMMPMLLPVDEMGGSPRLSVDSANKVQGSPVVNNAYCSNTGDLGVINLGNSEVAAPQNSVPQTPGFSGAVDDAPQMMSTPSPYYPPVNTGSVNPIKRRRLKSKRHFKRRNVSDIGSTLPGASLMGYKPEIQQMQCYSRMAWDQAHRNGIADINARVQDPATTLVVYPDEQAPTPELKRMVEQMKIFLVTAPIYWNPDQKLKRFHINNEESISCILWNNYFYITGTDIVRSLKYRFCAFGRPVKNMKKFEEGIFSDLRNLKPGFESTLESSHSEFLRYLYKGSCIKTQKKQKVFHWFSVPHDRLFMDALERDFKREALGIEPTSTPILQMPLTKALEKARDECLISLANNDIFCGSKDYPIPSLPVPDTNRDSLGPGASNRRADAEKYEEKDEHVANQPPIEQKMKKGDVQKTQQQQKYWSMDNTWQQK